jgi:signal transduction histidine kinase
LNTFAGRRPYILVALAVISAYAMFIYLQSLHEENISSRLLQEQKARQELLVQSITQNIGSDLDRSLQRIKALSETLRLSIPLGHDLLNQTQTVFSDIRSIAPFDELFIVYRDGTGIKMLGGSVSNNTTKSFAVTSFNITNSENVFTSFIQDSFAEKRTQLSSGYNIDGKWKVAITVPIFDFSRNGYVGLIGISITTLDLVERYGNVLDTTTLRLVFYDKNATLLAGYPLPRSIIGKSLFSPENQKIISDSGRPLVNDMFRKILSGQVYTAEFDIGDGSRLVSGSPIYVESKPIYYLNIPTPFSQILSPVQDLLHTELLLNVIVLLAFTATMSYLIFIMSQWGNKMNREVKKRTHEIEVANSSLSEKAVEMQRLNTDLNRANQKIKVAYENLKKHDKLQKEFVNVVAHELRTPVQSIMGFVEMMDSNPENRDDYMERLKRNTARLERLTTDTLDIARIESGTFRISKEKSNLRELIKNAVDDFTFTIHNGKRGNKLKVMYVKDNEDLSLNVDKSRIAQVLSNLLSNANKFTKNGYIVVKVAKLNQEREIEVKVIDNGQGIDKEILPKLFEKFVTKSDTGTGIGLYISKQIILAHGGRIWGKNNDNEKGAEFGFSLPYV